MHKDVNLGVAGGKQKPAGVWPEELQRTQGKKGDLQGLKQQMELKLQCREKNLKKSDLSGEPIKCQKSL